MYSYKLWYVPQRKIAASPDRVYHPWGLTPRRKHLSCKLKNETEVGECQAGGGEQVISAEEAACANVLGQNRTQGTLRAPKELRGA